jgi:hypothetical protein
MLNAQIRVTLSCLILFILSLCLYQTGNLYSVLIAYNVAIPDVLMPEEVFLTAVVRTLSHNFR